MPRMNPEWKAKWVAALRSGEYKQGKRYLRKGDEFCCLGVLTDLAAKEGHCAWGRVGEEDEHYTDDGTFGVLPIPIARLVGVTSDGAREGRVPNLYEMNDDGATFLEIADIIEKEF